MVWFQRLTTSFWNDAIFVPLSWAVTCDSGTVSVMSRPILNRNIRRTEALQWLYLWAFTHQKAVNSIDRISWSQAFKIGKRKCKWSTSNQRPLIIYYAVDRWTKVSAFDHVLSFVQLFNGHVSIFVQSPRFPSDKRLSLALNFSSAGNEDRSPIYTGNF